MTEARAAPARDHTLRLADGRTLGYADYGGPDGRALLYFHGHPGSRREAGFLAAEAARAGLRLIGVDRPGMGLSSYQPGRRLAHWPGDVAALADALGLERFAVAGFSGGGPYALASASAMPQRLTACGVIAGVGHTGGWLSFLSMWVPWLVLPLVRRLFQDEGRAERSLAQTARGWVAPDRRALALPGVSAIMAASLVEALRPGARGAAYDGVILGRPWEVALEEIAFPRVYLWHGELDNQVPVAMGRRVAGRLAHCQAVYYPDEGHISLIANRARDIVQALT